MKPVYAQTVDIRKGALPGGMGDLKIDQIVAGLIRVLVIGAAVVFFIWLILGGIKWITSGGDKAKTEEARNQITAALVGLVIVFSAWAIAQLISVLFGVDFTNLTIPSFQDIGSSSTPTPTTILRGCDNSEFARNNPEICGL